jgi:transcriptional regulator with XRE-family HTH domain
VSVVPVNPAVLKWAREERRLSREQAAERLGVSLAELDALEGGTHKPTIGELRKIAGKYEITFAALLMPAPLPAITGPQVKDFRTVGGEAALFDHDMVVELEDISQQMNMLAALRDNVPDFFTSRRLPQAQVEDNPIELAASERREFGISIERQLGLRSDRDAFLVFRARILSSRENPRQFVIGPRLRAYTNTPIASTCWLARERNRV